MSNFKHNTVVHGDNIEILKEFPSDVVGLTVTSPPYDKIRNYSDHLDLKQEFNGYSFNFEPLAQELYRVTKPGRCVVWVVGDMVNAKGSYTGNSFRQALYFKEIGFNIHQTIIYGKNGPSFPASEKSTRYSNVFEYMFVLSKGRPEVANLIKDRKNHWAGHTSFGDGSQRGQKDELTKRRQYVINEYGIRFNIWQYNTGKGFSTKDEDAFDHPAIFPEKLAQDHIRSWSNSGDLVLDPFCGSGTTLKMAVLDGREFIGIDVVEKYVQLSSRRVKKHLNKAKFLKFN